MLRRSKREPTLKEWLLADIPALASSKVELRINAASACGDLRLQLRCRCSDRARGPWLPPKAPRTPEIRGLLRAEKTVSTRNHSGDRRFGNREGPQDRPGVSLSGVGGAYDAPRTSCGDGRLGQCGAGSPALTVPRGCSC
jgi:hypothetical protein